MAHSPALPFPMIQPFLERTRIADRIGIVASSLCALHCIAVTVALAVSPLIWLKREVFGVPVAWLYWTEITLAAVGIGAASIALFAGVRRHGHAGPALFFIGGSALLLVGVFTSLHFVRFWGTAVVVAAGTILIGAHLWNLALARSSPKN